MKNKLFNTNQIYYGWYIVAAGALCIFGCLGFGRFALGMLLPAMAPSLNLNYSQMGLISTANFIGYLLSVLLCSVLLKRITSRNLIFSALIVVGSSMILISTAKSFFVVLILYFLTGIGSGLANVPMMALVPAWFSKEYRGRAAGFIVIGSGFAIIVSGWLIPYLNSMMANHGWRVSWLVLGITVLLIAIICFKIIRNKPEDVGLSQTSGTDIHDTNQPNKQYSYSNKDISHLAAIYFCFGSSYVIYATFIVISMVNDKGMSEPQAGALWSMVGALSLFSGPVLGIISDKLSRRTALIIVFVSQSTAYLLAALPYSGAFMWLSILFYGLVVWSIPSIMTALVSDVVGPQKTASVFGFVTFVFALGQLSGPAIAGYLAEVSGGFESSFILASTLTILGIFLSGKLKNQQA